MLSCYLASSAPGFSNEISPWRPTKDNIENASSHEMMPWQRLNMTGQCTPKVPVFTEKCNPRDSAKSRAPFPLCFLLALDCSWPDTSYRYLTLKIMPWNAVLFSITSLQLFGPRVLGTELFSESDSNVKSLALGSIATTKLRAAGWCGVILPGTTCLRQKMLFISCSCPHESLTAFP